MVIQKHHRKEGNKWLKYNAYAYFHILLESQSVAHPGFTSRASTTIFKITSVG